MVITYDFIKGETITAYDSNKGETVIAYDLPSVRWSREKISPKKNCFFFERTQKNIS